MAGPLDETIRIAKVVDENIEAEKNVTSFKMAPVPPIAQVPDLLDLPNYSGIQKAALKTSAPLGTTVETDPIFLSLSGSFITSETDPIWLSMSGSYLLSANNKDYWTSGSTRFFTTDQSKSLSGSFSGSTIWGTTLSGSAIRTTEDHSTSGSAAIVGIITHTSATPPTASNYPIGTIYVQYTA